MMKLDLPSESEVSESVSEFSLKEKFLIRENDWYDFSLPISFLSQLKHFIYILFAFSYRSMYSHVAFGNLVLIKITKLGLML